MQSSITHGFSQCQRRCVPHAGEIDRVRFECYPVSRSLFHGLNTTMTSSSETISAGTSIRKMSREDLPAVARLHCSVFPAQLLTLIGPRLIQRFYEQFIAHGSSHAFVAYSNGEVVGFVAGTTNKQELFHGFYRANLLRIGLTACVSPPIWSA